MLATFWLHSGYIVTKFWLHFDYILATFWLHLGYILATFWLHLFWLNSGYILTTFWLHSGYILATFWLHLGYIWATFWLHSGYILAKFWLAGRAYHCPVGSIWLFFITDLTCVTTQSRQNCTTPPFNRNFGIFLGWHVIIWDGSQVKAFPNPDQPPLTIFLTLS